MTETAAVPPTSEDPTPPSPADPCAEWLQHGETAPAWTEIFDTDSLQSWAREVKAALAEGPSSTAWPLVGPRIALECADADEAADLLWRTAQEAGLRFARVPADAVTEHADDLCAPFIQHAPVLAMLDWGLWSFGEDPASVAFASRLRRQLQRFDPAHPVLFAVCAESASSLCADYRKVGAFDRVFALQEPTAQFVGERFLRMLGQGEAEPAMRQAAHKVGLVLMSEFESRDSQALAALALRRLARREGRPARLNDLTDLSIRGTHETSVLRKRQAGSDARRRTAYHEAGHACIAVIASGGANVPDYASIVPARDFEGVVLQSLAYLDAQDDFTFDNLLLRARIALAGRAGEELACGSQKVSSGANSDLERATRMTYSLFAHSGFHAGMERGESSGPHLAVLPRGDAVNPFQSHRIHRDVRAFLANQYAYVMHALTEHRAFVDAVAERLLWDPVIDQDEMTEIARQHGIALTAVGARAPA